MKPNRLAILLAIMWAGAANIAQAQTNCAHGKTEDGAQRSRRTAALGVVRAINDAESSAADTNKAFQPLSKLSVDLTSVPDWIPQLTTDGRAYLLLLVDKADACRFAFASTQDGVIFQAYPIDIDIEPTTRSR